MKFRDLSRKIRAPFNRRTAFNKLEQFHGKKRSVDEIIDMAMDFKTTGLYRVDSVQKRDEILALATAVKAIKPRTILEIGTCNGGTLFIWSNLASDCVITCDLNKTKIREELYQSFPPEDSDCTVTSLAGDSHDENFLERVKATLAGREVDFLFIDGDHSEETVRKDFANYGALVRPGGIVVFDNYKDKNWPGPTRAMESTDLSDWHKVGIYQKTLILERK